MSDYYRSLDFAAKTRYAEKLLLAGLKENEDPYLLWEKDVFKDDMTKWPPVEYGNIFCYFVDRPGTFTRAQLLQWKSMEAYNYFQSGHVRNVKTYRVVS